jgi:DNA-binding IclR family transcriptional regulator
MKDDILVRLRNKGPAYSRMLANELGIPSSTAHRCLRRLVREGFAMADRTPRERLKGDVRLWVEITPAGMARSLEVIKRWRALMVVKHEAEDAGVTEEPRLWTVYSEGDATFFCTVMATSKKAAYATADRGDSISEWRLVDAPELGSDGPCDAEPEEEE